jgi:cellulose synthase/poly-beta-1,6-N-acetylglucosamine synthase-like glycosyltransferase
VNNLVFIPVAIIYFLVAGLLFLFGLNFMYLIFVSLRRRPEQISKPKPLKRLPKVTVQLPIYNEMYVAERLVKAAAQLKYPKKKLEIQVLDDSTDETYDIVRKAVKQIKARGFNIVHMHRKQRDGYKAGALRDGFAKGKGEFFAIFDADFIPQPEFLQRTLPQFKDPKVAFVQTRWGHLNRSFSFLTLLQSLAIDAHFMVEQLSRNRARLWFNFNGTAGIWRRKAIEDAGGWKADTLTEDLDLSYRAFLKGYRARFLGSVETPAELPITFNAFRRQQHRWAKGSLECAVRLLPTIWRSKFPLRLKISSTFHLMGYGVHLLLFAYCLLQPFVIILSREFPSLITLFSLAYFFSLTALAPSLLLFTGQHQLGRPWWRWLPIIMFITAFGAGMMLNTVRAALEVVNGKPSEFRRTPKFGANAGSKTWMKQQYHLKLDPIVYWEIAFGLFNAGAFVLGLQAGYLLISLYAAMFAFGFIFNALYTIGQTLSIARVQQTAALEGPRG